MYIEKRYLILLCWLVSFACSPAVAEEPFMINVVDRENGWPVPLVKLTTTSNVELITDNAGIIAFDLPELMDRETWLFVDGDGYQVEPDGFGFHGLRVTPQPGKSMTIQLDRTILSQRIGRLTGSGLFAESQKCGQHLQWRDQGIVGCDSIRLATHQGKLHWVWGDTGLPRYPLGLFHALGATTQPQPLDKFEPPLMLRFDYFRDDNGIPRDTAVMPGDGPTWLDGVVSLPDREGNHRLVCYYAKIKKPMNVYQCGLCVWNQETKQFDKLKEIWNDSDKPGEPPPAPNGHVTLFNDDNNQTWALFGDPFPTIKCPATFEAWSDPQQWQQLESPKKLKSIDGQEINVHRGSIQWNPVRKKWICVFGQVFGKPSVLGEIWYTESDSPFGPWSPALKILSHQNHSFYNPRIQTELMPDGAEFILFEGTYTQTFSASPKPTPRYDYNQILYRVDFKDIDSAIDKARKTQTKNSNE
jgi:hypothetical protein